MRGKGVNTQSIKILETMPINKLLVKLSIPSLIGILSYNLYNIINTIYVSRGINVYAAGGVAITFPLFLFLSALSTTLGAGASSVISRAIGENDLKKASRAAANTFLIFWVFAIIITITGLLHLDQLLYAMGVTDQLMPFAHAYTKIILIGTITSTGFSNLIRAEGSSKYAMYQWIIPIVANLILDPILIFVLDLGVRGAAIATVLSQGISVAMFLHYYFIFKKTQLNITVRDFILDQAIVKEICLIGIPSFIQMMSQSITILVINNILKTYNGDLYISAYGIVNKIVLFFIIPVQGLLQGMQPIIGYNYGAKIKKRVEKTFLYALYAGGVYGVISTVGIMLLSKSLLYLFTNDVTMIEIGSRMLKIIGIGMFFLSVQMIHTTYFQSVGKSKISLFLSLCNNIVCVIPTLFLFSAIGGLKIVWFAIPVSNIVACVISVLCMKCEAKRNEICLE